MREMFRHTAGRIFLCIIFASIAVMLYIPVFFFKPHLMFGWMPLPFSAGIIFLFVLLVAYLVYFFRYWPYRD